ncbi:MAG: ABC transporter ATP-binding protein [Mesorhizobium sp.]|nr:MAG: ABC transporter ATP-binding protein [Mesorhizobium sp.]
MAAKSPRATSRRCAPIRASRRPISGRRSPMLELKSVDTSYGPVPMLRGVAMSVRPGELVCLLGQNGAGKTTTFMTVCGVVRALRGKVVVMGRDMATLGTENLASLGVGLVPEGRRLFPSLTVIENLRLGYDAVSGRGPDFAAQLDKMCTLFPRIRERLRQVAGTLSGGEQAMLALARALVSEPRFILLDEPSAGLSPLERIKVLTARGIGILMVEQNIREAMPIADRLYILAAGEKRFEGTPEDVRNDRQIMDIYMGGA